MKLKRTVLGPVLVAGVAFVSGGWLLQQGGNEQGVDPRVFDEVLSRVSRDYVDAHPQSELYRMAVEGLLYELGDPHTSFMSAEDYNDLRVQTTGEYGGLGIQIAERNGWVTVIAPLPGTPAERAGMRAGDRIIQVDGKSTEGWSDDDAVKVLRGPKGTAVKLQVARPGVDEPIAFSIVRAAIQVNSLSSAHMVEPGVGLLRLNVFAETSTQEMRKAIDDLRKQGMRSMIIDLRTNPGGLLDQGVSVSDLFLKPGQSIVETRGRDARDFEKFGATRPAVLPETLPIVVLVDEYSASAAEIVAGALQDHDRALVVGTTTFGKGSVQTLFPLSGGNFLKMTTGRWYTPSGRSIQKEKQRKGDPMALLEDGDTPSADSVAGDTAQRKPYKTNGGRVVYGGGGIVPDLIIKPDSLSGDEKEFFQAASKSAKVYNDVVYRFAVDYTRSNPNLRPDFLVTDAMLEQFVARLRQAGVQVTPKQVQGARDLVRQRLDYEISQAKFGTSVAAQRANRTDEVVRAAVELLKNAPNQQALFRLAESRKHAARS